MDDYISKPVDQHRLQEVLDNWREKETESTIISREQPGLSKYPSRISEISEPFDKGSA
jgi:response regulator of citrate/malate metabolism